MKWLHISDLHIVDRTEWNVFKKDLLSLCNDNGPIDLVIVTGDFHNFDERTDFSKAKEFLIQLIKELDLDIEKDLFVIAGNHDGSSPVCEHKDGNIAILQKDPNRINGKEWKEQISQFEAYELFVKDMIQDYPCTNPAQVHLRIWNNKIGFIHCNSAVVSDATEKKNQLLDIDELAKVAQSCKLPSIILAHNNYEDLHEKQQKQIRGIIRTSSIKAYFCGDRHKQQVQMISSEKRQNCQIPCIGSYKSAPDPEDTYSTIGAIIGSWIDEKAELYGWTWSVNDGFGIDNEITGQTIEIGEKYNEEISSLTFVPECSCNEHVIVPVQKPREYSQIEFRKLIFNMSDLQRKSVNQKFYMIRNLSDNETIESIDEYWTEINGCSCKDEVIEYIRKIYEEK